MRVTLFNACITSVQYTYPTPHSVPPFHLHHAPPPTPSRLLKPSCSPLQPPLETLSFPGSTSYTTAPLFCFQGPKVEGGHASARSMSFDAQSAAAAARSGVPIDLMTVAARVDAGKPLAPTRIM